jgi:hypothetical protein
MARYWKRKLSLSVIREMDDPAHITEKFHHSIILISAKQNCEHKYL